MEHMLSFEYYVSRLMIIAYATDPTRVVFKGAN